MRKEVVCSLKSIYRSPLEIVSYHFGEGEKSVCIVGSMRGNELEQLYTCAKLVERLKSLEQDGLLDAEQEIAVIPTINTYSMNIGKRFWTMDNTDINRMFPGYEKGETTQRLAARVFEKVQGFKYGIQFSSFYIQGDFLPHIRMMETGYQSPYMAKEFGLPYVVIRQPKPYDTTTLNYNWQIWETTAFSIYMNEISSVNTETERRAEEAIAAVLRFLKCRGILKQQAEEAAKIEIIHEKDLVTVKCERGGFYRQLKFPGDIVKRGEAMAQIIHPYEGHVLSEVKAPESGIIFFGHTDTLANASTVAFKLIT